MKKILLSTATLLLFVCTTFAQDSEAHVEKANAKILAMDYKEAVLSYDRAIALDSKDALTYYNRGIAKLNLSDSTAACADLTMALELGYKKAEETIVSFCNKK